MSKSILFFGSGQSGKSHIALYSAKLLALSGQRVAVIDSTISQGCYFYFNYSELEIAKSMGNTIPVIRENIDIFTVNPLLQKENTDTDSFSFIPVSQTNKVDALYVLSTLDQSQYDFILIEADDSLSPRIFAKVNYRFMISTCDKEIHVRNASLLESISKSKGLMDIDIIYNQHTNVKYNRQAFHKKLEAKIVKVFEVPFCENDYLAEIKNKHSGRLDLKPFSSGHNEALIEIVDRI